MCDRLIEPVDPANRYKSRNLPEKKEPFPEPAMGYWNRDYDDREPEPNDAGKENIFF